MNTRVRRLLVVGLVGGLLSSVVPAAASASQSPVDPTFGSDGSTETTFSETFNSFATAIATDSGNRIVVGGWVRNFPVESRVARYSENGHLDTTFGNHGSVAIPFHQRALHLGVSVRDLVIDNRDRSVVVGTVDGDVPALAIARLTATGALDRTFAVGGQLIWHPRGRTFDASAIARGPGGTLLVAGTTLGNNISRCAVVRLTSRGALDRTFGIGGSIERRAPGYQGCQAADLTVGPHGEVAIASTLTNPFTQRAAVLGVWASGQAQRSFGSGGTVVVNQPGATLNGQSIVKGPGRSWFLGMQAVDRSGAMPGFVVARVSATGRLVKSFGVRGRASSGQFAQSGSEGAVVSALLYDRSHGLLTVIGNTPGSSSSNRLLLAQLTAAGKPHTSFGGGGWYSNAPVGQGRGAFAATWQRGRILTAGFRQRPDTDAFQVSRFIS